MSRFSKDNSVEGERFRRQAGRCALCRKKLVFAAFEVGDRGAWHAHHIDGNPTNNTLGNCAVLCLKCHHEAHDGDWRLGALLPKSAFALNQKKPMTPRRGTSARRPSRAKR